MSMVLNEELIAEMAKVGVIYGHKKSKTHPRMKPFIVGSKNEIELIDPEATMDSLEKAIAFIKEKIKPGGLMLLVGTNPAAKSIIEEFAGEFNFPFVINRWLGGTLTNFKIINQRVQYYQGLKDKQEKGELNKYTKKEQREFNEEISKLTISFKGLVNFIRLPDILFVVDIKIHDTAVREARRLHIPIVAILDTDDNIDTVDYPVLANDHARSSIEWIVGKIKEGIKA